MVAVDSDSVSTFRRPLDAGATPAREAANHAEQKIGEEHETIHEQDVERLYQGWLMLLLAEGPRRLYVCHGYYIAQMCRVCKGNCTFVYAVKDIPLCRRQSKTFTLSVALSESAV